MIAMGLLFLMLLYIAIFIVVGLSAKRWATRLFGWGILLAPLVWKTWDIPVGYHQFKQACKMESGLKSYDSPSVVARRIRLNGDSFGGDNAEFLLRKYLFLQQIEAKDHKFHYLSPTVYALYERLPNGKINSALIDEVGILNGSVVFLKANPSHAEYVISQSTQYLPHRLIKNQYALRQHNGHLVATVTSFGYTDSDPDHSLFAMPWGRVKGCGPSEGEKDILIDLIKPKITN